MRRCNRNGTPRGCQNHCAAKNKLGCTTRFSLNAQKLAPDPGYIIWSQILEYSRMRGGIRTNEQQFLHVASKFGWNVRVRGGWGFGAMKCAVVLLNDLATARPHHATHTKRQKAKKAERRTHELRTWGAQRASLLAGLTGPSRGGVWDGGGGGVGVAGGWGIRSGPFTNWQPTGAKGGYRRTNISKFWDSQSRKYL